MVGGPGAVGCPRGDVIRVRGGRRGGCDRKVFVMGVKRPDPPRLGRSRPPGRRETRLGHADPTARARPRMSITAWATAKATDRGIGHAAPRVPTHSAQRRETNDLDCSAAAAAGAGRPARTRPPRPHAAAPPARGRPAAGGRPAARRIGRMATMDLGIEGKVALVTGGSRGIGRAIAAELVQEGALVAISSRSPQAVEATAAEIGARAVRVRQPRRRRGRRAGGGGG